MVVRDLDKDSAVYLDKYMVQEGLGFRRCTWTKIWSRSSTKRSSSGPTTAAAALVRLLRD